MRARIKNRQEIAKGTLLVDFAATQEVDFEPGQYLKLILPNGDKRYFCLVNSPLEEGILTIATRFLRESAFKKSLQKLPLGSEVEIEGFWGDLLLPDKTSNPLVFIAGGIGITPFMSMLRYVKEKNLPYQITLLYSNPDQASTAFLAELRDLAETNLNFKLVVTMTKDPNWRGESRRVDTKFIKDYVGKPLALLYYVVGPPAMVEAVNQELLSLGIAPQDIRLEHFTGY